MLLHRDELSGWFGSFERYVSSKRGSADAAFWLSCFNGESVTIDRKTGTERTTHVPNATVSIVGGIQPGTLRRSLSIEHRESGLAARLLMAFPPRRAKRWTEAEIGADLQEVYQNLVVGLFNSLQPIVNELGEETPISVGLTPKAKSVWVAFCDSHADELVELTGDLAAAWSKLEAYAARLALVVHFVRSFNRDPTLESEDEVDEISIAAAIRLVEWFKRETRRVYAMFAESDEDRERRRLLEWIDRQGGVVTSREVQMGYRRLRSSGAAEAALESLVRDQYGVWEFAAASPKGGRPSRAFRSATVSPVNKTDAVSGDADGNVDVDDEATSMIGNLADRRGDSGD